MGGAEAVDPPAAVPGSPADATAPADLYCPLCDYDLRGLAEPRCPECGHRFEWRDFTDPERKHHPYLFEHHRRRRLRSFVRTLLASAGPRRFWLTLRPTQPSYPGRLLLYWLLANLLLPLAVVALFVSTALANVPEQMRQRAAKRSEYRWLISPGGQRQNSYGTHLLNRGVTADRYVDFEVAPPLSLRYVRQVYRERFAPTLNDAAAAAVAYLLWPWLTFVTLMIFRASMRRAKVKTVHVLRCVLYSCDAGLWAGLLVAAFVPPLARWLRRELPMEGRFVMAAAVVFAAFTAYRVAAAYRLYLRFDHPAATAIASQAVVLLAVLVSVVCLGRLGVW
jgi:hypothetical protein